MGVFWESSFVKSLGALGWRCLAGIQNRFRNYILCPEIVICSAGKLQSLDVTMGT